MLISISESRQLSHCIGLVEEGWAEFSVSSHKHTSLPNVLYCRFLSQLIVADLFYGRPVLVCDGAGTWRLSQSTHLLFLSHVCFIFAPLHTFQHCPGTILRSFHVVPDVQSLDWRRRFTNSAAGAFSGFEYLLGLSHRKSLREVFGKAIPPDYCFYRGFYSLWKHEHSRRICSSWGSQLDQHSASRYITFPSHLSGIAVCWC